MPTAQIEKVIRHVRKVVVGDGGKSDSQLLDSFLAANDQAAFEALVRRHGPMILAVCRRVLKNRHDAEDAFQATFLVFVRKAASIQKRELLANWLYGVAHRTAMKARTASARRCKQEARVDAMPQTELASPDELIPRLDEALARLPEKYRVPVVLCDLEGMSRPDAARKLGWPVGTVNWRLAKARAMLAKRLSRQGVSLSVGAVAAAFSGERASASLPPALVAETVKAGTSIASGAVGGVISPTVFALTEGVLKTMLVEKLKTGTMMLLAVVLVGAGGLLISRSSLVASEPTKGEPEVSQASEPPKKDEEPPQPPIVNFRVEAPTLEIARKVGLAAEQYRKKKALEWLGHELADWPEPCPIRVKLTVAGSDGVTAFAFDNGKVVQQSMSLEGSLERMLNVQLPHEMTHVVLAHHFGTPIPRWADEGAAILSSAEVERRHYGKQLQKVLSEPDRLIPLRRLFPRMDFSTDLMALYAEGCSVTRFLVEAKDRKTFLKFIAAGQKNGLRNLVQGFDELASWEEAVEQYYGYASVDALEEAWLKSVASEQRRASDSELLQGRWISTSWEEAGKPSQRDSAADYRIEFRDDTMTIWHRLEVACFATNLDPTTAPRGIELRCLGTKRHGIYRLEGDRLTLCLDQNGDGQPRRFSTNKKDGFILIAFKREKNKEPGDGKPPPLVSKTYSVADLLGNDSNAEKLIKLIKDTVEPSTWSDNGGRGTIDYFPMLGPSLISVQTEDCQQQIEQLIASLRNKREFEKPKGTWVSMKLEAAFGKDYDEVQKAPIKLDIPARHLVLAAKECSILNDGKVKCSGCWYALFDKDRITTIRCDEACFTLDAPVDGIADLAHRKIVAVEPSGRVRIEFRPARASAQE
jgi:RNA polymerase sigma factor (sigma-70 family)